MELENKYDLKRITGKRLSEAEIQAIKLVVEKAKVKRERASLLINKGITLYFSFLVVAIIGFTYNYIGRQMLDILVVLGFGVLFIAAIPYIQLMKKSEDEIDSILDHVFR